MNCSSTSQNFQKFISKTKFNLSQIKNFNFYFKKYSKDGIHLTYTEFKNSLGIIGFKAGDFICNRLFDLITVGSNRKVKIDFI